MSQSYTQIAATTAFPCSDSDYRKINKAMIGKAREDGFDHGVRCEFHTPPRAKIGQLYIYADECGDPDQLTDECLSAIASALKKAKLPFLEFGVAYYDDKCRPESCGGYRFRIMADGTIVNQNTSWSAGRAKRNPTITALESARDALNNVPCVGEVYDQQHSDTHLSAVIIINDALGKHSSGQTDLEWRAARLGDRLRINADEVKVVDPKAFIFTDGIQDYHVTASGQCWKADEMD